MRQFFPSHLCLTLCFTITLTCPCVGSDLNTTPDLDEFLSVRSAQSARLDTIYVEWQQDTDLSKLYHDEAIASKGTFVKTSCRMAAKGKSRFYDRTSLPLPGFYLDERYRRQAMVFDGSETHILEPTDFARIFPGDERSQFGAPDEYLALQLYPTSGFYIFFDKTRYSCDLTNMVESGEYKFSAINGDESSPTIISLARPRDTLKFDSSLGFAIVSRVIRSSDGLLTARYSFTAHSPVPGGGWLAKTIECRTTRNGELIQKTSLSVAELEFNDVPDKLFKLDFPPGTIINDMRHFPPDADGTTPIVTYQVPNEPGELDRIAKMAVEREKNMKQQITELSDRWSTLKTLLFNANIIFVVILLFLILRRRLLR